MGSRNGTVKYDGVEERIGLAEPDMEEGLKGILMVASNSPVLSYETLPFFGKRSQRAFSISSIPGGLQTQTSCPTDSTKLQTFVGSQSSSIESSSSNSFAFLHTVCWQMAGHIGID
jgi:hypothetical protein